MSLPGSKSILLSCLVLVVGAVTLMVGCGGESKETAKSPTSDAGMASQERTESTMTSPETDITSTEDATTEDTWAVKVNGEVPKEWSEAVVKGRLGDGAICGLVARF